MLQYVLSWIWAIVSERRDGNDGPEVGSAYDYVGVLFPCFVARALHFGFPVGAPSGAGQRTALLQALKTPSHVHLVFLWFVVGFSDCAAQPRWRVSKGWRGADRPGHQHLAVDLDPLHPDEVPAASDSVPQGQGEPAHRQAREVARQALPR